jgi:hypothetical protein
MLDKKSVIYGIQNKAAHNAIQTIIKRSLILQFSLILQRQENSNLQ